MSIQSFEIPSDDLVSSLECLELFRRLAVRET